MLLIDADAQGSLTASLGYREPDKLDITLANVMGKLSTKRNGCRVWYFKTRGKALI